jgi:hypothetical protein
VTETESSQNELIVELKETNKIESTKETFSQKYSRFDDIIKAIRPFSFGEWRLAGVIGKIMLLVKIPIILVLKLSTPLVDEEAENNNWNKCLIMINCLIAPTFVIFVADCKFKVIFI